MTKTTSPSKFTSRFHGKRFCAARTSASYGSLASMAYSAYQHEISVQEAGNQFIPGILSKSYRSVTCGMAHYVKSIQCQLAGGGKSVGAVMRATTSPRCCSSRCASRCSRREQVGATVAAACSLRVGLCKISVLSQVSVKAVYESNVKNAYRLVDRARPQRPKRPH